MQEALVVMVASEEHVHYASEICLAMETAAKARGTGIAKRKPEYVEKKMREGKAVIALAIDTSTKQARFAGFCYIETWSHGKYVANSGLIVLPDFRQSGLAKRIKERIFQLSREKYPTSKIFGITTSHAVMKINTQLGYVPVPFSELTTDEEFWKGCQSCPNFDILTRTNKKMCLCTGMLYDPNDIRNSAKAEPDTVVLSLPVVPSTVVPTEPEQQKNNEQSFQNSELAIA